MRMSAETLPKTDVDTAFEQIVGQLEVVEIDERTRPDNDRITVMLDLPHLKKFGHDSTRELVYGCNFPVAVGDQVLCPPTPLYHQWTTGVVTALDGKQYRGRVKYVRKIKKEQS